MLILMEIAFALYEKEMDNDGFVNSFDGLMRPVVKAVEECEKVLQAHTQQATWKSKTKNLAFWLR